MNVDKIILKHIWKGKESTIAKTTLKKKSGEKSPLDFNNYCIATEIKTM